MRCLKSRASGNQGIILPWRSKHILTRLLILLFADDIVLFDTTLEGLQALLDIASEWANHRYLKFSTSKSFTMHLSGPLEDTPAELKLGNAPIRWENEATYLGVPIYANLRHRSDHHAYDYKQNKIGNVGFAIRRLLMKPTSPLDLDISLLRMCVTSSLLPLALYPTAILDIDYKALDVRINDLLRQALKLPYQTHVAYLRTEVGLWHAEYLGHATALRFLWRLRHQHWTTEAFNFWRASSTPSFDQVYPRVTILKRYHRILLLYGLSWDDLRTTTCALDWAKKIRTAMESAVKSFLKTEERRISFSIMKSSQVTSFRLSGTSPLPPHYSLEANVACIDANFRSDRVRCLDNQQPSEQKCLWCREPGKENGRHFLECSSLPEELGEKIEDLKQLCRENGILPEECNDFLMLDWTPDPPLLDLIRLVTDLQRQILHRYRIRFYDDIQLGPAGFADLGSVRVSYY